MRINVLITILFSSIVFYSFSGYWRNSDLIGCTELNGTGCVCHNLKSSPEVIVWVEGPDTLQQGQTGLYRMYMAGGPAAAGGYNVAVKFGVLSVVDSLSYWDYRIPYELTQAFPLPFANPSDTIFWEFAFTADDSHSIDTIYSCGLSTNWDSIPDYRDLWAFGPKYPVTIVPEVPVELISFNGTIINFAVELNWITATEINNSGFIVQRSEGSDNWEELSFISGNGSTTETSAYSFIDKPVNEREYLYRLKQLDYNGSFSYSETIAVDFNSLPDGFSLTQNYPNPFNPSTAISFSIPSDEKVKLTILNMLGEELSVPVNETLSKGTHRVEFNAEGLPSGIYLYKLETPGFSAVRKMMLVK